MRRTIEVRLPEACPKKWEQFEVLIDGRLCHHCNHVVVDFSAMTDAEVVAYFQNHQGRICARIRPAQLKVYTLDPASGARPGIGLIAAGFVGLALLLNPWPAISGSGALPDVPASWNKESQPENALPGIIVIGRVVATEDGSPLPGVNVNQKGTSEGTITDTDGRFKMEARPGSVLVISFIGYETIEYVVPKSTEAALELRMTADTRMLGEMVIVGELAVNETYASIPARTGLWQRVKRMFKQ